MIRSGLGEFGQEEVEYSDVCLVVAVDNTGDTQDPNFLAAGGVRVIPLTETAGLPGSEELWGGEASLFIGIFVTTVGFRFVSTASS